VRFQILQRHFHNSPHRGARAVAADRIANSRNIRISLTWSLGYARSLEAQLQGCFAFGDRDQLVLEQYRDAFALKQAVP
jgi:hypothetical protein